MPKVLNYRTATAKQVREGVFIGRPTPWGNPFVIGIHGTRAEVIELYRQLVMSKPHLIATAKRDLRGKDLICFCAPLPCHGDVLLEIANARDD